MYAAGHKIVYCRVGSLETLETARINKFLVYCRVGSLENYTDLNEQGQNVYCRVGSLEIKRLCCDREIVSLLPRR